MDLRDVPNLDFVRSAAVISVVVEHLLLALRVQWVGPFETAYIGVLGVMVFFVLTSLVLMWSLERKPHTLDFYIRRCFRLYPLAWAAMAIALVFRAPTGGTATDFFVYAHPHLKHILAEASLLEAPFRTLLTVMWSLPYEMQMYLLLPALFFFVRQNFSIWPLMAFWLLVVGDMRRLPPQQHNFGVAIAYFLPGVMAYVGFGRWRARLPGSMLPVFLVAIWVAGLWRCNFHRAWAFCLVVGLALPLFRQMSSEAVLRPSRIIARYSYGVYLLHPFAIVIGIHLLRHYGPAVRILGVLVPLIVLPVIGYHLIEAPMIRLGSRIAQRLSSRWEQIEMHRPRTLPVAN